MHISVHREAGHTSGPLCRESARRLVMRRRVTLSCSAGKRTSKRFIRKPGSQARRSRNTRGRPYRGVLRDTTNVVTELKRGIGWGSGRTLRTKVSAESATIRDDREDVSEVVAGSIHLSSRTTTAVTLSLEPSHFDGGSSETRVGRARKMRLGQTNPTYFPRSSTLPFVFCQIFQHLSFVCRFRWVAICRFDGCLCMSAM